MSKKWYGIRKLHKGLYQLDKMTDVGQGNGERNPHTGNRTRWQSTPVLTGSHAAMEAEAERLNRELAS